MSNGRLLRVEHEGRVWFVWEPPANLLAWRGAAMLANLSTVEHNVAFAVVTHVRHAAMPVEEGAGLLWGIYTGHVVLVWQLLAMRSERIRDAEIARNTQPAARTEPVVPAPTAAVTVTDRAALDVAAKHLRDAGIEVVLLDRPSEVTP